MDGFADYYGQTSLDPLALAILGLCGFGALFLDRRHALIPFLVVVITLPMPQRLVLGGADLTMIRLMLLVYLIRILLKREWRGMGWCRTDTLVLLWVASSILAMTLYLGTDVLANRLGYALNVLGAFFIARALIRGWEDVLMISKTLAVFSLPMAVAFGIEKFLQFNPFSIFSGVGEFPRMTEGRVRAMGPNQHPIMAGAFWASVLPFVLMLWRPGLRNSFPLKLAIFCCVFIIFATSSSTSILSLAVVILGLSLFPLRKHRTKIWVALIFLIAMLHVVMNAPVWHLMARLDILGGSTGWHRYVIFDAFLNNFSDWYLLGYDNPREWRWQMRDITNEYILIGLRGGLLTLLLFLFVLMSLFGTVGRALKPGCSGADCASQWRVWLLGVVLFMHVVTFFGVSYFAQVSTLLILQFGVVASVGCFLGCNTSKASAVRTPPPVNRSAEQLG